MTASWFVNSLTADFSAVSYCCLEEQLLLHPEQPEQLAPFFFCFLMYTITNAAIAAIVPTINKSAPFILTSYE
jgi:hypothetical protein